MVQACLEDAGKAGMRGAAVMVRDGPWMADRQISRTRFRNIMNQCVA